VRTIALALDFRQISSLRVAPVQKVFNAGHRACPRDARVVQPRDPEKESPFQCRATLSPRLWKPLKFQLVSPRSWRAASLVARRMLVQVGGEATLAERRKG
jgi:hypothetical protein